MRLYEVRDSGGNATKFPEELLSAQPLSHMLNCAKLLHGRADIKVHSSNKLIKCRKNYSTLKRTRDGIRGETFVRDIFGSDITESEGAALVSGLKRQNTAFFKKLEVELTYCCANHLTNNPLTAFLHLYRAIEKIAVAFPLTYISSQADFERSLEALRSYFADDKGELAFARKFSERVAAASTTLNEYDVEFSTYLEDVGEFEILTREIGRCCPGYLEETVDVSLGKFSIEFIKVSSFIIDSRNRLFHFSNSGQKNFDIDRIGGVSELCRMLVEGGLHWLALSFDEVLQKQTERITFRAA